MKPTRKGRPRQGDQSTKTFRNYLTSCPLCGQRQVAHYDDGRPFCYACGTDGAALAYALGEIPAPPSPPAPHPPGLISVLDAVREGRPVVLAPDESIARAAVLEGFGSAAYETVARSLPAFRLALKGGTVVFLWTVEVQRRQAAALGRAMSQGGAVVRIQNRSGAA